MGADRSAMQFVRREMREFVAKNLAQQFARSRVEQGRLQRHEFALVVSAAEACRQSAADCDGDF